MVPAQFVTLERLPLTPNGKADRKALPPPHLAPVASAPVAATAPVEDGLERRIGEVWAATLGQPTVARDANLFDSGGNSLLAVRLHRRLREDLGLDLKLTDVFKFPTIAQLAGHLAADSGGVTVAAPPPASRAELRRSALGRRARV
jgi:aryl carrier-like protein